MLKHFWKTAIRNLIRKKLFTAINITGLSISIAVFLALTGYVRYQLSFDDFYPDGDNIYRINYYEFQQAQPVLQSARTHDRTALLVQEYIPQIEAVTRLYNEKAFVYTEDVRIVDQDMLFVDSSFFKVFPLHLISGSSENSLKPPNSVVISQSQARSYFGSQNPMGKILFFNERLPMTVTGVFEDLPSNTSIKFDFLLSWSTLTYYGWASKDGDFKTPWTFTYVRLKKNAGQIASINAALTSIANKHNITLKNKNHTARHDLTAFQDLHTTPDLSGEIKPSINKTLLYALISLAVFILLAAWINYINLSLAQSLERGNEIGVRKVFGASRFAISGQFLLEALILSTFTFLTGYGLYLIFTGPLSWLFFTNVIFMPLNLSSGFIYLFGFIIATTLIAFYPAHFISKFKPAIILKNKLGSGKGNISVLHQSLMIFQLFLAISLVGITIIADRQIQFMQNFDSGFNSKQTISLRAPASTNSDSLRYTRYTAFRSEVLQNAAFRSGTSSQNIPGQEIRFHDENVHAVNSTNEKKQLFWIMWTDEGYQDTFGLTLLGGRNFNQKEVGRTCIINETAAIALGYKNPLDAINTTIITTDYKSVRIIGVWQDYHHESIKKSIDPIIFYHRHPVEYGYYSFGVNSREGKYLPELQKIWNKHYPNDQFIYYFMDDFYGEQYKSDELFGRLLSLFTFISIIVSSLGLFGMASLAMVKRTKEIGVRKVLGASVLNILALLSKNYIKLIVISCAFAFPLIWYLTNQWLKSFAIKVGIQWWIILFPGAIVLVVTLLTVASQSIRAALANPTKSLRDQ